MFESKIIYRKFKRTLVTEYSIYIIFFEKKKSYIRKNNINISNENIIAK